MKINWKLRLKNRTTLLAILVAAVALVYRVLGLFGAVPAVPEKNPFFMREHIVFGARCCYNKNV